MDEVDQRESVELKFSHFCQHKNQIAEIKSGIVKCERITASKLFPLDIETIIACGMNVKEFRCNLDMKASDLIAMINAMPKLETFDCEFNKIYDLEKVNVELKVPSLKVLNIECRQLSSAYEFFTQFLPQNQIVEHECKMSCCVSNKKDPKADEWIRKFFTKQSSIKKLKSAADAVSCASNVLELDELEVETYNLKFDPKILRSQPKLKIFKFNDHRAGNALSHFIDDLCELSELEVLELDVKNVSVSATDSQKLKKLKNLKDLKLSSEDGSNEFIASLLCEKHRNLEGLIKAGDFNIPELLENVPNLTHLFTYDSNIKLNTFMKFLPKLKMLNIQSFTGISKFIELDTGIVNQSIETLMISCHNQTLEENVDEVLEIFEICPNLEMLMIDFSGKSQNYSESPIVKEKFFESLSEVKSLKQLTMNGIKLKNCENHFPQIADELIKLAVKIERIDIDFEDKYGEVSEDFNYDELRERLRGTYVITVNYQTPHICRLAISHGDKDAVDYVLKYAWMDEKEKEEDSDGFESEEEESEGLESDGVDEEEDA